MRKFFSFVAVMLIVLCFSLGTIGCAFMPIVPLAVPTQSHGGKDPADNGTNELLRMTISSLQEFDGTRQNNLQILEFDDKGLPISITVQSDDQKQTAPISYTWNEQGDPSGFSLRSEDDPISAVIENHYENGTLTEVVFTDFLINGRSMQESDALEQPSIGISTAVTNILQYFLHYTGYRDCSLRVAGTENEFRFERGRLIFSYQDYGNMHQETTYEFGEDGGQRVTVRTYSLNNGEKSLQSSISTLTDAELYEREMTVTSGNSEPIRLTYRYEDGSDPETGAAVRSCYYDQICVPKDLGSDELASLDQQLEQMRAVPVARIWLDEAERVIRREQTDEYQQLSGGQKTSFWYDESGRVVKQETRIEHGSQTIVNTTEYEYRP